MTTDAKIQPALSAEEWAQNPKDVYGFLECGTIGDVAYARRDPPQDDVASMAIANNALPDDSPHKITRADIEAMVSCVERCDADEQTLERAAIRARGGSLAVLIESSGRVRRARRLAAKLAALLPPE